MTNIELRKLRLALDLTQSQMAKRLLMSRVMYGYNERGIKPISKRTAALVATINIECNYPVSGSQPVPASETVI